MKILSFFICIFLSGNLFSQYKNEAEMKSIIAAESARFAKMNGYNINPNTLNYDLRYQRLELSVNPNQVYISGSVTSHFIPNTALSSIYFDFTNTLTVSEVSYHGISLPFSQLPTKELKIDFPAALPAQQLDSLRISYAGVPSSENDGLYFENHGNGPIAFTITEPYGSREWFPTKQSLNDKIERADLVITSPSQYSTAANGLLISETTNPNNTKTAFWRTNYPIPAYLIAIGVSNYVKLNDTMGNPPFPFVNYIFPSTNSDGNSLGNINFTKDIMALFEENFSAYPYREEKYGHMEMTFTGSGMEHSTMSTMGGFGLDLIAHELMHQWFGDKITCGAWNDIWLNEGFATFGQQLAREKLYSTPSAFRSYLLNEKNYITNAPNGSVYVPESDLGNVNRIFSGRLSYSKGAYVLRMLKWILGDEAFFQAIKEYVNQPTLIYNYAKTPDFAASLLASTGQDFTEFLNDWVYNEGYPTYTIKWKQNGSKIILKASQSQSHSSVSFFEMALPIKLRGASGQTAYLKLNNTANDQFFEEEVDFTVTSVEFNYDYQVLERNSTVAKDLSLSTENAVKNSLFITPNPVKNQLHLHGISGATPYEILTADGRILMRGTLKKEIEVTPLTKGVYFLKTESGTYKFIKE